VTEMESLEVLDLMADDGLNVPCTGRCGHGRILSKERGARHAVARGEMKPFQGV